MDRVGKIIRRLKTASREIDWKMDFPGAASSEKIASNIYNAASNIIHFGADVICDDG